MGKLTDISIDFFDHALFCRLVDEYFGSDTEYARFTAMLRENPEKGDVVENTGGARKVRYPDVPHKKGARGGLRVIYFYFADYQSITCVAVYRKSDKSDLTADEKRVLRVLSDALAAADAKRKGKA